MQLPPVTWTMSWLASKFIPIQGPRRAYAHSLESNAADQLVRSLLGDSAATAELRALIVERTGGTPLFIEETVRTLVESGVLRTRDGGYELTREIREIQIPETVQSVIAARIDSLQIGSDPSDRSFSFARTHTLTYASKRTASY
jgi:DNA-binding IscR family transcriptional regulator